MSRFFKRILDGQPIPRVSIDSALAKAESEYQRFNPITDREQKIVEVEKLSQSGTPSKDIAHIVGLTQRSVVRLRAEIRAFGAREQAQIPPRDLSQKRIKELERTADVALQLACVLRTEDPQKVFDTLRHLDGESLIEFAMVVLAALPVDQFSKKQLFKWLDDLPVVRYEGVVA